LSWVSHHPPRERLTPRSSAGTSAIDWQDDEVIANARRRGTVALLVLAAIGFERGKVSFVAAGLAAFAFPFFWDALAEV
jgi:hypothetical protein